MVHRPAPEIPHLCCPHCGEKIFDNEEVTRFGAVEVYPMRSLICGPGGCAPIGRRAAEVFCIGAKRPRQVIATEAWREVMGMWDLHPHGLYIGVANLRSVLEVIGSDVELRTFYARGYGLFLKSDPDPSHDLLPPIRPMERNRGRDAKGRFASAAP